MVSPQIARVILFVKDVQKVAAFYERFFGMHPLPGATEGWVELAGDSGGCHIAIHKAGSARKGGTAVKIVFGVADVRAFKSAKEEEGLRFGAVHETSGFMYCDTKDPAGNPIQISSR